MRSHMDPLWRSGSAIFPGFRENPGKSEKPPRQADSGKIRVFPNLSGFSGFSRIWPNPEKNAKMTPNLTPPLRLVPEDPPFFRGHQTRLITLGIINQTWTKKWSIGDFPGSAGRPLAGGVFQGPGRTLENPPIQARKVPPARIPGIQGWERFFRVFAGFGQIRESWQNPPGWALIWRCPDGAWSSGFQHCSEEVFTVQKTLV